MNLQTVLLATLALTTLTLTIMYNKPENNKQYHQEFLLFKQQYNTKGAGLADNAVVACFRCNNERGDRDAREFLFEKMGIA